MNLLIVNKGGHNKDEKTLLVTVIVIVLVIALCGMSFAELYKVHVKRIGTNLYKDLNSGIIIETQFCYKYTFGEDVILKYEPYSFDNKLIFDDGSSYRVVKIYR